MTDTNLTPQPPKPPAVQLYEKLEARRGELKKALPADISVDHFIRALMTSVAINPDLLACSFPSIWIAIMKCCRDALLPDGVEAALIPYKTSVTYVPMYQGLMRNFRRSGQFKSLSCNVVRDGEEWDHYVDENGEHIMHRPGAEDGAAIKRAYAVATLKDGGVVVADLGMTEINKIKMFSRNSRDDAPWKLWPEEMMKKTALRRLSKLLPTLRDLMASDLDEHEPPKTLGLDEIGSVPAPSLAERKDEDAGTGGENVPDSTTESRSTATNSPPIDGGAPDLLIVAWRRGREAAASGAQRKALPPEYRTRERLDEGKAWQDGFDNKGPFGKEQKLV